MRKWRLVHFPMITKAGALQLPLWKGRRQTRAFLPQLNEADTTNSKGWSEQNVK